MGNFVNIQAKNTMTDKSSQINFVKIYFNNFISISLNIYNKNIKY